MPIIIAAAIVVCMTGFLTRRKVANRIRKGWKRERVNAKELESLLEI